MTEPITRRLVIGVDGSSNSIAALRWAAAEASHRGATLVAVTAYSDPLDYSTAYAPASAGFHAAGRANAKRVLDDALDEALGEAAQQVVREIHHGPPARVLVAAAASADMLVLGARGHTGLAALVLGSTASAVVRHAPCPVVIVPATHPAIPQPASTVA